MMRGKLLKRVSFRMSPGFFFGTSRYQFLPLTASAALSWLSEWTGQGEEQICPVKG
jgi:hypothetical protein